MHNDLEILMKIYDRIDNHNEKINEEIHRLEQRIRVLEQERSKYIGGSIVAAIVCSTGLTFIKQIILG